MSQGELHFSLREKTDRAGRRYLFGGIRLFNVVVFVRADVADAKLFHGVVKPYSNDNVPEEFPWTDPQPKG